MDLSGSKKVPAVLYIIVSIFLERSLVNHLDEAIIGESIVEEVKSSDNETLKQIEAIFENSNSNSSNNKGKELRHFDKDMHVLSLFLAL